MDFVGGRRIDTQGVATRDQGLEVLKRVGQAPRFDEHIVEADRQRNQHTDDAEVAEQRALAHRTHDRRRGVEALAATVAAHRPFGPSDRDAEEDQRREVGDHERAAAVVGRLPREAQEVAESDRGARDSEDHPEAAAPFLFLAHGEEA